MVATAGMGAPEALLERGWGGEYVAALRILERVVGRRVDYLVAVEEPKRPQGGG